MAAPKPMGCHLGNTSLTRLLPTCCHFIYIRRIMTVNLTTNPDELLINRCPSRVCQLKGCVLFMLTDTLLSKRLMCTIHSSCPLSSNRLSHVSQSLNQSLILSPSLSLSSIHLPISPALSVPPYLHFLWPLNTSLRLLELFLKSQDDFPTSALPLINNT